MLKIEGLYKERKNNAMKDVHIRIDPGSSTSIECNNEMSDLLIELILGAQIPSKGAVYLEGVKNTDYVRMNMNRIGVVLREEGFYKKTTIQQYMRFFSQLVDSKLDYKELMLKLGLLDIAHMRIERLNYSQKRRVSFARERLKEPKLLIFQEPILNMDKDGAKIIVENIEELRLGGTAILMTSVAFKDTLMLGEYAYRLDNQGLIQLDYKKEESNDTEVDEQEKPIYKVEKIPAKMDEKILLFDPTEIDYVESQQGVNYLNVRGDKFPCNFSLTDLEERLKYFGFFRCHRSYLVNLQRVREVVTWTRNSYSLNLDDQCKSSIPLSKGRLDELKTVLKL